MIKVCFAFNNLQVADGVARSVIAIANSLVLTNSFEIYLRPLFKCDLNARQMLDRRVKVKPVFGFYFKGMGRILEKLSCTYLHRFIYQDNKYDVEIGFQHGVSTCAVASGKNDLAKKIIWVHGLDEKISFRKYYEHVNRVVAVSNENAMKLKSVLSSSCDVRCCYNIIDEEVVWNKAKEHVVNLNYGIEIVNFIAVGRLSPEKGFDRIIKAASVLKKEKQKFKVIIIGGGIEESRLRSMIVESKLQNNIIMIGEQENPYKYMARSDVLICSSKTEGMSTVCMEACLLNVPVITTSVGGSREIIGMANSGMIVENSDEGILDGMRYILNNKAELLKWKRKLKYARGNFYKAERINDIINVISN